MCDGMGCVCVWSFHMGTLALQRIELVLVLLYIDNIQFNGRVRK